MGNIGDPITPSIPIVGASGPQYATDIDAILTEVVARLSTKIPLSSLLTGANFDLGGQSLLNAAYITLTNTSSTPTSSPSNRITAYQGNLYWVSLSGVVQMTSGATINAAGIGGITGDYGGANPAQLYFDAATSRYNAYSNFGTLNLGYIRALGFDVAASATSAFYARLAFTGGATYTLTLPTAVPGSTSLVQMSNSGQLTASNTASITATLLAEPVFTAFQRTNLISLAIGNAATNNMTIFPFAALATGGAFSWTSQHHGTWGLRVGDRIQSITTNWAIKTAGTATWILRKVVASTLVSTDYQTWTDAATGSHSLTTTITVPPTIAAGEIWYLFMSNPAVGGGDDMTAPTVTFDHP